MWWVGNTYRRSAHHARLAVPVDVDARPGFLLDAVHRAAALTNHPPGRAAAAGQDFLRIWGRR
jgi:hypothetical protein